MITQLLQDPIGNLLLEQREFFTSGQTKKIAFRIAQLQRLKRAIADNQAAIIEALNADLRKPELESYAYEIGIPVIREIDVTLKKIKAWTKPKNVSIPLEQFPANAKIYPEPLGVVLIMGAWNYPWQLVMSPLVGAIAAGNCAIIKPSEIAVHTSEVVASIIQQTFDNNYIAVVEGSAEISQQLLAEKFDHIFFTGGTKIGKIVMEAAAKQLTPVTLELGGKSPCLVDRDIDIETTARRIVWGKFINAGQTCLAPDYLLVDRRIKSALVETMKTCIAEFYGSQPEKSPDYGRIVNDKQFHRLLEILKDGEIIIGGQNKAGDRYIAPTVIHKVDWESPVMQEEIFGPILPVLEYSKIEEAIAQINARPKPLALYLFSRNQTYQQMVVQQTSSGSICFNDTAMQFGVSELPFGGIGNSGIGSYHGKASFDTFSHYKSVLNRSFLLDLKLRYPPYQGKLKILKWIIG